MIAALTSSLLLLATPPGVALHGGAVVLGDEAGRYDERPPVEVVLRPYRLATREVSHAEYAAFVEATGYEPGGPWRRDERPGRPVRWVTGHDASAFCRHHGGRLPTEAEWEAAARVDDPSGDPVVGRAVADGPAAVDAPGDRRGGGLDHLGGNVREWVADWYDRYAWRTLAAADATPTDPRGPRDGASPEPRFVTAGAIAGNERSTRKVVRGASWATRHADATRPSRRDAHNPHHWYPDVGFRCAWPASTAPRRP